MDIEFLKMFAKLAETENISEAADLMNISQSSLSAGLVRLEKELGCDLFDRKGKRVSLNRNGMYLLKWSERILQREERNREELESSVKDSGVIRIAVRIENDSMYFMLSEFQEQYPDIRIELYDEKSVSGDLTLTDFDMFVIPEFEAGTMPRKRLARQDGLFLMVKQGSRYSVRQSVNLEELAEEHFVFAAGNSGGIEHIYEICLENGLHPHVTYLCEGPNAKIDIILNTGAVGVVYNTMRHFRKSIRGLETIPIVMNKKISNDIVIAWRQEPLNPLADVLAKFAEKYERDPETLIGR